MATKKSESKEIQCSKKQGRGESVSPVCWTEHRVLPKRKGAETATSPAVAEEVGKIFPFPSMKLTPDFFAVKENDFPIKI